MLLLAAETLLGLCNVIDYVIDKRGNIGRKKPCQASYSNSILQPSLIRKHWIESRVYMEKMLCEHILQAFHSYVHFY